MTAERKIERIAELFVGLDTEEMTTFELQIHEVLKDQEPTAEQKQQARNNSDAILDAFRR